MLWEGISEFECTARQAEMLAGIAKVKRIVPCHLSPQYIDRQHDLLDEALEGSRLLESGRRTLSGSGLNQRE
jgi:ribonuclease BN (tRNA processing enzyme)